MADVDNVKLAEQFNKLFSERRVLAAAVTREMRNQLELATQIATIVGGMKPEDLADKLSSATKVLDELKQKSQETGDQANQAMQVAASGADEVSKNVGEADKKMKTLVQKFPALKSVSAGAFNGLVQGFKNVIALGKSGIGILGSFAGGIFKIAKSILAIPLKIFQGLLDEAADFSGDNSFLVALENLRKEFGDFGKDVSKNVLGAFKTAQAGITGTGLSTFRVLGTAAQQLEYFTDIAKNAGPQFHEFGKSIADEAGKFVAFEKGLGIGADHVRSFLDRAKQMGTTWQEEFGKTANYSLQLGDTFDISQKVIGKDIAMMMKDVKNFGSMTQKEMATASVYTRKLGIEVKSITQLMDKFDTFESAANSAAMLSQAFGTSVDSFKLMQAQSPAEKLDMLRKSMAAAGKTTENMSYQEKKLLAQTVGLDEATSNLAFSAKNQGVSLDQIKKKAEEAERAPLRQAAALEKLAASIERVVMSGQPLKKQGFIDTFLEGFSAGIKNSPEFIRMMFTLRNALLSTRNAGVRVGKVFVKAFGGGDFAKILNSITDAFTGWNEVMQKVEGAFRSFFVDFDVRKLVENFQKIFIGHFSAKGNAGKQILSGVGGMFNAIIQVVANGGRYVIEELTKGLQSIGPNIKKYLADPEKFTASFEKNAGALTNGFLGMMRPLINLVRDEKLWTSFYSALTDALKSVWELIKKWIKGPTFQAMVGKILPAMVGVMVVPTVVRGAAGSVASSFVGALGESIKGSVETSAAKAGKDIGEKSISGILSGLEAQKKRAPEILKSGNKALIEAHNKESAKLFAAMKSNSVHAAEKQGESSPAGPGMMQGLFGNPYVAAAAIVAAAAVAGVGASNGMEKFYDRLKKDTEVKGTELDKKVGASVGGIVQLLSFGLISDEAAFQMTKNFTSFSVKFNETLDKVFGKEWADNIRSDIENRLGFLTDFGGFLKSLIGGDIGGAATSFVSMFQRLYSIMVGNLRTIFIDIPAKIINFISSGLETLTKFIEDVLASSDGPSSIWKTVEPFLSNFWTGLVEPLFNSVVNLLKALTMRLPMAIGKLGIALVKMFFVGIESAIKNTVNPILDLFGGKGFGAQLFTEGHKSARNFWNGMMTWLEKNGPQFTQKLFQALKISETGPQVAAAGARQEGARQELEHTPGEKFANAPSEPEPETSAEKTPAEKMYDAQRTLEGAKAMQELQKMDVQKIINDTADKLAKIDFEKLNTGLTDKFVDKTNVLSGFVTAIGNTTSELEAKMIPTLKATQDIISSIKELDSILASGDATKIAISKNLTKLAANAGLGGNDKYTIQNKGVQINLDLKVVMNAEDLEEALVLRTNSIIKDSIKSSLSINDDTIKDRLRRR